LRPEIDISQALSNRLLPQLVASLKSTNANVREAGQQAGLDLLTRCHSQDALQAMAETLMKTLKDGRSDKCAR
jgi:hypothetical protein